MATHRKLAASFLIWTEELDVSNLLGSDRPIKIIVEGMAEADTLREEALDELSAFRDDFQAIVLEVAATAIP